VPYPLELNDSPQIIHRQHTAREFCDKLSQRSVRFQDSPTRTASRSQPDLLFSAEHGFATGEFP